MHREEELKELAERLKQAAGQNLRAVVLYGSAAADGFHEEHSDLNVLVLLDRNGAEELKPLQPVSRWWLRNGHPAPLVFTLDELQNSADVFAIELLDIQRHHHMLVGDDFLRDLRVPMILHRLQVERELWTNVIRLRRAYLNLPGRRSELIDLMIASASSFATLFRHSLIALGKEAPASRRDASSRLAELLGFDAAAFHAVLDIREGKLKPDDADANRIFAAYLRAVTHVAAEMDRRFAAETSPAGPGGHSVEESK
jgi:predicted nucleotidyltransferase